jgi:hypothetical protein
MNATQVHGQAQLDRIELALIALLNAEAQRPNLRVAMDQRDTKTHRTVDGRGWTAMDRWRWLRLPTRRPEPWLVGWDPSDERLYTTDPELLLEPVPRILGTEAAIAMYTGDPDAWHPNELLRYHVYWRIPRVPRPYRCLVPGAVPYVCETRLLHLDGHEVYQQALEAWNPRTNRYVPIMAPGESHRESLGIYKEERLHTAQDRARMVFVASCIEDTFHRWQVRVSEVTSVCLSTDGEGIKALASLRDDPRTASGKRAPLLHWVRAHLRRTPGHNDVVEVRRHLRGITQFRLGTVDFEIREPRKDTAQGVEVPA